MNRPQNTNRSAFYWRIAGIVTIALVGILLVSLVGIAFKILLFVLSGILFAGFFRGIAHWISDYAHISMKWSLTIAVIGVFVIIAGVNVLLAPKVAQQLQQIAKQLPSSIENARQYLDNYWWGRQLIQQIPDNPQKFLSSHSQWAAQTFGLVSSTFGALADLYIILLIGIFFMITPTVYMNGIISLVPVSGQSRAREIIHEIYTILQRWLTGKLLSMLVVAILTFAGLLILGIPMPLFLALFAGVLAFVPNFGPIISLIPAVLVGFLAGPATALYVVILYIVVQAIESNLITPFIQREMVYLPLAMIIIAQVMLGLLVGGLGLILATPIVAVLMVLIKMIYIEDLLGQKVIGDR